MKPEEEGALWLALFYNRHGQQPVTNAEWPHFAAFCERNGFRADVVRIGHDGKPWVGSPGRAENNVNNQT